MIRVLRLLSNDSIAMIVLCILCGATSVFSQKINRKAVVQRHNVRLSSFDTLASLSVGNGRFAMTVDATGLQTFPVYYQNGIPLGTQGEWGWHSFPNPQKYTLEESLKPMKSHGRTVPYAGQWSEAGRNREATNFVRQNPHRLQLGNLGFELTKKDGSLAQRQDISNISQTLDLWNGVIYSQFVFDDEVVEVETACNQNIDAIRLKIKSKLIKNGQLKLRLVLPYPTDQFTDYGTNYNNPERHSSTIFRHHNIKHTLDSTSYYVGFESIQRQRITEKSKHYFVIEPDVKAEIWDVNVLFSGKNYLKPIPLQKTRIKEKTTFASFWQTGASIDFGGSTDPRAQELERRIVLSQYLTKIQCSGNAPPQETGLTYNSWYGKPHLEMHWWHGVHFALWGRAALLEKSMQWYHKAWPTAKKIAQRQGFEGVRWPKMTDNEGGETASSVGSYLIWQQPHPITFAELLYKANGKAALQKYQNIVFASADFMASFAYFDVQKQRYILGTGIIPAQERYKPDTTYNPTYELHYWYWALTTAQTWRKRLNLPPNPKWQAVIDKLPLLPVKDGVYLATESTPECYTNPYFLTDHPAVFGALGMLPASPMIDKQIMRNTFEKVWKIWHWDDTWGWDFPLTAMTANELDMPEKAIEALLMPITTNTYLPNGHNYQTPRLRLYLPGNGGLLAAVAMICTKNGFPKQGWKVRQEGFVRF